jgi:cytochrome c553
MKLNFAFLQIGILAVAAATVGRSAAADLSFNRDVRPILSDKCFSCHGFDPKARKADRRLDTPEGATAEIEGVRAIVPGDLKKSDAWQRIIAEDKDEVMPPPKSHKTLSAAEKEILKRWIEQGARYDKHWSFEPPQRAPLPKVQDQPWVRNPIDAYVLAGLEHAGLKPAPEADRRTLARRVALDLTGLPPTPEQVEAFVNDPAPDAYEKLVAKLMASPQWGEHRGRYWLDAARYADTHGIHIDNYREMWPYRDWVIAAFNRNQRFDEFTVEQIAGDLLPNPTREQLIATGFHRCNVTTAEGGTIAEENLAMYANDRVTTTSWVWLGLTANCAACHDHKFDPITQKDFYAMAAYFRNTTQPASDGNVKDTKPVIYLPVAADEPRFAELPKVTAEANAALSKRRGDAAKDFAQWLATAKPEQVAISSEALAVRLPLDEGSGEEVRAESNGEGASFKASGPIEWRDGGKFGRAPAFSNNAHFDLGDLAGFDRDQPFSVGAWVNVPANFKEGAIVARMDDRKGLQGWELFVQNGKFGAQLAAREPAGALRVISKNGTVRAGKWQHVLATYDGSGASAGFRLFVDGRVQLVVAQGKDLKGPVRADVPLRIGQRETASKFEGGQVQDVRVYLRELSTGEARSLPDEQNLRAAFAVAAEKRTPAQKAALLNFYVDNLDGPSIEIAFRLEELEDEKTAIQERATVSHIQEEKPGEAMANILMRGAYDKVGEKVTPAGFSALHPMPADAPKNRLGLARWLVAPENPLTARVTVNRFWQEVFGTGLVRTPEDFGAQGERPSNPDLLDWLAVEFRESGWDVKKFFTLMVTSATYRQAGTVTPEKVEKDPQNRLLSRGPRFRMDAEMVRDYALAASGTLSPKMGGPGTKPYQPDNIWEVVGLGGARYTQDKGENLYRRTIYNFWKRQSPSPNMEVFNAPTREACTVRRERTNTPLQALVTLNDPQFVEAARRLAEVALKEGGEPAAVISTIARRVLLRPLSAAETEVVVRTESDLEQQFAANAESTKAFLAVGESKADPNLSAPQLAALTMVASQLLNLDEALNK